MRPPRTTKWVTFDGREGLLLFAQALDEALFDHTVDSYKAPALNVHTLAHEARAIVASVIQDRIKVGTLEPVLQELLARIGNSPLLSTVTCNAISEYRRHLTPKTAPKQLAATLDALRSELATNFWIGIRRALETEIGSTRRPKQIVDLVHAFICEAELRGFSRSHIYMSTNAFFFNTKFSPKVIDSIDRLGDFLKPFYDTKPSEYTCIFRASKSFDGLTEFASKFGVLITEAAPNNAPSGQRAKAFLAPNAAFPRYLAVERVDAMDVVSAQIRGERRIQFVSNLSRFLDHELVPTWGSQSLVYVPAVRARAIIDPPTPPMLRGERSQGSMRRTTHDQLVQVARGVHFTDASVKAFFASLEYHRAAVDGNTPQNQLLDLWAAIEGLIPPPTAEDNRITHFMKFVLPPLCLTYSEKVFRYVDRSVRAMGPEVLQLLEAVQVGGDPFLKTAAVLTCTDLEAERLRLLALVESSPLLGHRLRVVHGQFCTNEAIRETLTHHRRWVSWHLQRIYSTRNQIAHSANNLPYLDTLVENLHHYFDTLTGAIVEVANASSIRMTLSAVLQLLAVHEDGYYADLKGTTKSCVTLDFGELVFGKANPLSPVHQHFLG